jgi:cell division protein FtsQ
MSRPSLARLLRPLPATGVPLHGAAGEAASPGGRAPTWTPPLVRSLRPWALIARLWATRRRRIALLCALVALPLLAAGWTWFRSSSLVAVRHVQIVGVSGAGAPAIDAALTSAARRMSTLDFSTARLREAVSAFPLVSSVHATTSFPSGVRIQVVERVPVAALVVGNIRTAVAADGVALGPALLSGALPTVAAVHTPAAGGIVSGEQQRAALVVLGAAPSALLHRVQSVSYGARGLTVSMRGGLLAYFGDDSEATAKWLALARVLADPTSTGASYVDVRVPQRPAAGFPEGVAPSATPAGQAAASGESHGASGSTVAALAENLEASNPGASSKPATGGETTSSTSESESSTHSESATEGNEAAGTEAAAGGSAPAPETSGAEAAAGGTSAGGSSPEALAAAGATGSAPPEGH